MGRESLPRRVFSQSQGDRHYLLSPQKSNGEGKNSEIDRENEL
jgi:hypothetical protein